VNTTIWKQALAKPDLTMAQIIDMVAAALEDGQAVRLGRWVAMEVNGKTAIFRGHRHHRVKTAADLHEVRLTWGRIPGPLKHPAWTLVARWMNDGGLDREECRAWNRPRTEPNQWRLMLCTKPAGHDGAHLDDRTVREGFTWTDNDDSL
jgi:hypothetical protein